MIDFVMTRHGFPRISTSIFGPDLFSQETQGSHIFRLGVPEDTWANMGELEPKKGVMITPPKTNSSPLKMVVSNRNLLFQGSFFRGYVKIWECIDDST